MGVGNFGPTNYYAVLGPYNWVGGGIWQSFQAQPGTNYTVSFDAATFGTSYDACWTRTTVYNGTGTGGA